jgi:hypothetical protein
VSNVVVPALTGLSNAIAIIASGGQLSLKEDYSYSALNRAADESSILMQNARLAGDRMTTFESAEKKKQENKHPGGGGVNVQKVEIVVSANDDPSRVARLIHAHLANIARNPKSSRDVKNYSASRT